MNLLKALYRAFRSTRLAIVLLLVLAALAIADTVLPQALRGRMFASALFLLPAALFFLNTAVCAVDRFARRVRLKAPWRFGPDLVHLGILVLIAGAIVTAAARREATFYLAPGDSVQLTEELAIELRSYRFETWPDGRPRDWVSTVDVTRRGAAELSAFAIEVNRPLRVGGLRVLQADYGRAARAALTDAAGSETFITSTRALRLGRRALVLTGIEDSGRRAVFEEWEGHTRTAVVRAAIADKVGEYVLRRIDEVDVTGLRVVHDPGFVPVLAALALIAAGLLLSYVQKMRDGGM